MASMERKILAGLGGTLLIIISAAVGWMWMQPPEPIYHGKPIGYWITLGYFPRVDSNAIPFLVHALQTHNGVLTRVYARSWGEAPHWLQKHLVTPVDRETSMMRANAAQVLGQVGTNSPAAIRGLLWALEQDDESRVRVFAAESLQQIGKGNAAVARAMIEALHDRAPEVRDAADDALWQIDPAAAKARLK